MYELFKGNRKAQVLENLSQIGVGVAALAITLVVVFLIMSNAKSNTDVAADANATAALSTLQVAADQIPSWVGLIIIAAIGGVLLLLVRVFRSR